MFFSTGTINLATAAIGTLVAFQIAASGGSQATVSLAAASYSLGFLIGCFFISRPLDRVGHIRAFAAAAALCAICTLVLSLSANSISTILVRWIMGVATAGLYAIGDAWINDTAGPESRGRTLSIYAIVFAVTAAVSQILVATVSDDLGKGFVFISILFSLAIVALALTRTSPPTGGKPASVRLKATFTASPTAFLGMFLNGAAVTILLNVMPFQAVKVGISATMVAFIMAAIYAGRILSQYSLGNASDRMDRRIVILVVSFFSAVIIALFAVAADGDGAAVSGQRGLAIQILTFAALLMLGGSLMPLYSLLVAHACDRTVPVYVASSAVTLLFVFTLGGVAGPLLAAAISQTFGPSATAWTVSVLTFLFAGFTALRMRMKAPAARAEQAHHLPVCCTSVQMQPGGIVR